MPRSGEWSPSCSRSGQPQPQRSSCLLTPWLAHTPMWPWAPKINIVALYSCPQRTAASVVLTSLSLVESTQCRVAGWGPQPDTGVCPRPAPPDSFCILALGLRGSHLSVGQFPSPDRLSVIQEVLPPGCRVAALKMEATWCSGPLAFVGKWEVWREQSLL